MRVQVAFFIVLTGILLGAKQTLAQLQYVFDLTIPVAHNGSDLPAPFAGGLNTAQYHHLDINNDGIQDLVLFDRSARRLLTYFATAYQYIYHP